MNNMYISNPEKIKSKYICTDENIKNYLVKNGLLFFFNNNDKWFFSETKKLKKLLAEYNTG